MNNNRPNTDYPAEERRSNISLRDIAGELGVSHVTVSLALRNHPRISKATKARVREKAKEMGYQPDPIAALSRYSRSKGPNTALGTLAWITPENESQELYHLNEFNLCREGASDSARRLGFNLEEFTLKEGSLKQLSRVLKKLNIQGVVIAPLMGQSTSIEWDDFLWTDFAVMRVGHSDPGPRTHSVSSAKAANMLMAYEKAVEKGYQRIGFAGNAAKSHMFTAGFLNAQQMHPSGRQLPLLLFDEQSFARQRARLKEWMMINQPDAILTDDVFLPSMLCDLGYSVPNDVALATMNLHDSLIDAGVDQNPKEIGRVLIRNLILLMNELQFGIPSIQNSTLVSGRWIEGSMFPSQTRSIA